MVRGTISVYSCGSGTLIICLFLIMQTCPKTLVVDRCFTSMWVYMSTCDSILQFSCNFTAQVLFFRSLLYVTLLPKLHTFHSSHVLKVSWAYNKSKKKIKKWKKVKETGKKGFSKYIFLFASFVIWYLYLRAIFLIQRFKNLKTISIKDFLMHRMRKEASPCWKASLSQRSSLRSCLS